jgi:hypothetical protein
MRAGDARSSATRQTFRATKQKLREKPQRKILKIAGSDCAAAVSATRAFDDRRSINLVAGHGDSSNARCTDSESRFLAIKKFSCSPAWCLVAARQNRIFARIDYG